MIIFAIPLLLLALLFALLSVVLAAPILPSFWTCYGLVFAFGLVAMLKGALTRR